MSAHRFLFSGGTEKVHEGSPEEQTYKFFLFAVLEDRELIFYDAVKQGLIKRMSCGANGDVVGDQPALGTANPYVCFSPEVKIFMASQGFGIRRSYYSFFFRFDKSSTSLVTITPFGPNYKGFHFQGRGRFMGSEDVKKRYGEDSQTYSYFCRQTYLSKSELREHVTLGSIESEPQQVRVLRI